MVTVWHLSIEKLTRLWETFLKQVPLFLLHHKWQFFRFFLRRNRENQSVTTVARCYCLFVMNFIYKELFA